jgi:hypothetical protein
MGCAQLLPSLSFLAGAAEATEGIWREEPAMKRSAAQLCPTFRHDRDFKETFTSAVR